MTPSRTGHCEGCPFVGLFCTGILSREACRQYLDRDVFPRPPSRAEKPRIPLGTRPPRR